MKKRSLLMNVAIASIGLIMINCVPLKAQLKAGIPLLPLVREDTIKINADTISLSIGDYDTATVGKTLFIKNSNGKKSPIVTRGIILNLSEINALYARADSLLVIANPRDTHGYVTALEISYGININSTPNVMDYYFRSLCLKTASVWDGAGPYTYSFLSSDINNNPYYYANSSSQLIKDTDEQYLDDRGNYISDIRIVHPGSTDSSFNSSGRSNPQSDALHVFFPFQEIYQLLHDNPACTCVGIYNIVGTPSTGGNKHDILLVPGMLSNGKFSPNPTVIPHIGAYSDMDADLEHMVPPDYGNLYYQIQ